MRCSAHVVLQKVRENPWSFLSTWLRSKGYSGQLHDHARAPYASGVPNPPGCALSRIDPRCGPGGDGIPPAVCSRRTPSTEHRLPSTGTSVIKDTSDRDYQGDSVRRTAFGAKFVF